MNLKIDLVANSTQFETIEQATEYYQKLKDKFKEFEIPGNRSVSVDIFMLESNRNEIPNKPIYFAYQVSLNLYNITYDNVIDLELLRREVDLKVYEVDEDYGCKYTGFHVQCIQTIDKRIKELETMKQTLIEKMTKIEEEKTSEKGGGK